MFTVPFSSTAERERADEILVAANDRNSNQRRPSHKYVVPLFVDHEIPVDWVAGSGVVRSVLEKPSKA
jgi:hypothetical protein